MTTIGNDLTVDGTITANQATQAGEAVVLGDDGLIPANLVASSGATIPYFWINTEPTIVTGLTTSRTKYSKKAGITIRKVLFGYTQYGYGVGTAFYGVYSNPILIPGIGPIAAIQPISASISTALTSYYMYEIKMDVVQSMLSEKVRTNLRGAFTLQFNNSILGTGSVVLDSNNNDETTDVEVNITDEGIEVISGTLIVYNKDNTLTEGDVYLNLHNISRIDEGWL